ncbi:alpha/beta hydrolase-fold protein [Chitinophaga sp. CB10]|uniref:alpha/beta hydrolase n=1 Tax=Chitinophaga sp. CB10 TaxID=1891659 RepID=UPI0025BD954B|nr:alpha/beta hydrolase-fold protein [Chitinophaga sp. CB10]
MTIRPIVLATIALLAACQGKPAAEGPPPAVNAVFSVYSKAVGDSFQIRVAVPPGYQPAGKYPVVYVLDANLYFDIYAATMRRYSEVGLLPACIVAGIGYRDFRSMDSLRNRDYTFPVAIPEYEMPVSGGADKFLQFLRDELTPLIDRQYATDPAKRWLMGHSLGGYFTLFALQRQLRHNARLFDGFIAASPSLHYNHYYLLDKFTPAKGSTLPRRVYIAYGGQEDADTTLRPAAAVLAGLKAKLPLACSTALYTDLDHMDTQLPAFVKGLQWISGE